MNELLKLIAELQPIKKDSENSHFHNKYFDINSLIDHLQPLLTKYGLTIIQPLTNTEGKATIATCVYDKDGKLVHRSNFPLPNLDDPQKMGSAITYYRRYSLQSLLFLQAEDDDGNVASGHSNAANVAKNQTATPVAPAGTARDQATSFKITKEVYNPETGDLWAAVGDTLDTWYAKTTGKMYRAVKVPNQKEPRMWINSDPVYNHILNSQK